MSRKKLTRSEQSRQNGKLSQGPVTDAGKARSALNRTSHGMYSCRVVLENESQEIFNLLADRYHEAFQPQDQFEIDLLETMINARWKIRRLEAAIAAEMNLTIEEHHTDIHYKFGPIDPATETALTFRINARYLDTLEDHLERQHRTFLRSYRALRTHRGARNLPPQEQLSNLETGLPANTSAPTEPAAPPPNTENRGFEPSAPSLLRKIAIIAVLLLSAIASTFHWNQTQPIERTQSPHAAL